MNVHSSSPRDWGGDQHVQELSGKAQKPLKVKQANSSQRVSELTSHYPQRWLIESCQMNENTLVPILISHEDWCDKAESFLHACLLAVEQ